MSIDRFSSSVYYVACHVDVTCPPSNFVSLNLREGARIGVHGRGITDASGDGIAQAKGLGALIRDRIPPRLGLFPRLQARIEMPAPQI